MKHRITRIKLIVYLTIAVYGLMSCRTRYVQVPVREKVVETIKETTHDTTLVTQPDSTWYWALIECRDGRPVITKEKKSGKGPVLEPPKVSLDRSGNLNLDCEARAQELFLQWKSQTRERSTEKEVPIYIEKILTRWEAFFMMTGKVSLGAFIAALLFFTYRIIRK